MPTTDLTLIYCAARSVRFAEIALKFGWKYGTQLPSKIHHDPYFVDQDWRNPDRQRYMAALSLHKPTLATVLDWEREEQFDEVMSWAAEASQYVQTVIVIPKVIGGVSRIPERVNGKPVRLGYSVPTRYAGTPVSAEEFGQRPVHLLGGSPVAQKKLANVLNVVSADGNYLQKMAVMLGCTFVAQPVKANNRMFPRLKELAMGGYEKDIPYIAFELAVINANAYWRDSPCLLRFGQEQDIPYIVGIARQYRKELGYVMLPSLKESIERRNLVVAVKDQEVLGFVNYRSRKDGGQTIYEIAVKRDRVGMGVGKSLLLAVPAPVRLKCPIDNASNKFYEAQGFLLTRTEAGRKRMLNVWEKQTYGS